ncbi:TnsA endonuclease N-terminal domain-containing protein [Vibrio mediterranei]|uniref:TnsA endonuclease N-terminal domain-containing protein n=1 Tax=Vibrio mediterranei TaxID=689 RepID=UPI0017B06131|nr:TnsA endonuclease N-terminal domain-containing protein [Vibrio mediterranei]NUW71696.1 TnsA endonuclease N-terminal domain-containing protein [Vibrio mediterranei]
MYDQTKKSSAVHNICKFMSLKNDSVIRTMSMLEFDFCFHAEYNPKVTRFESQPFGFKYRFNGRECRYTPDFQICNYDNFSTLVEVKHSSQINKADFRARFSEKQRVAKQEHQKSLILVTEKQIRTGFFLANLKLLHSYSGLRTVTPLQKRLLQIIKKKRFVLLSDVANELCISDDQAVTSALCWLASGDIKADLKSVRFGLDSHVWC